ncbi:MAG: 50S ribosomal protein L11 methyltransferase [Chloroflexales bacterium]|nr:50S ribosomal protein L11 methyltransferase [Chloroflexales bacterium]
MDEIWSSTDLPYQCLIDVERTTALGRAIQALVRPGSVVLDAGAGTGILSFFAAQAGASKVYAVEMDPLLAVYLRRSVSANGLESIIEVVQGDVQQAALPPGVDVVICEMMDTGLMDEQQIPVINSLVARGVIAAHTQVIPNRYETFIELGWTDFRYYGFTILTPKHQWSDFVGGSSGWLASEFQPLTTPTPLGSFDLTRQNNRTVDVRVSAVALGEGEANAVRISGRAHLAEGIVLGATKAVNGNKLMPTAPLPLAEGQELTLAIHYEMGGSLGSLRVEVDAG